MSASFSTAGAAANCTTLRMPTIREAAIAEASDTTNVRRLRLNGRVEEAWPSMATKLTTIQKCAWGFAALFLGVYLLDYVPGIMDANGLMFGLFHMTKIVDIGHLAVGALAVVAALSSARVARIYFYLLGVWYSIDVIAYFISHLHTISLTTNVLVNLPHILILGAAFGSRRKSIGRRRQKPYPPSTAPQKGSCRRESTRAGAARVGPGVRCDGLQHRDRLQKKDVVLPPCSTGFRTRPPHGRSA